MPRNTTLPAKSGTRSRVMTSLEPGITKSGLGRFMSPDWSAKAEPVPYANLDHPQTLNLYGYVINNPSLRVDDDGHCPNCVTALIGAGAGALIMLELHTSRKKMLRERLHRCGDPRCVDRWSSWIHRRCKPCSRQSRLKQQLIWLEG